VGLFVVGAAAIWFGGGRLPEVGNSLAGKLGISATAIGLFVLSIVTSLPELSVTLAAMLKEEAPNLAFGNIFGSNNFNITSIAVLELLAAGVFLHTVDLRRYARTCVYLLIMTGIAGLGVVFGPMLPHPALPPLLFSLSIIAVYLHDSITHGRRGRRERARDGEGSAGRPAAGRGGGTARVAWTFAALSAVVVAGGFAIARGANGIAVHRFAGGLMLGRTFVGTLLVAVATSMPEVSVAYSAIRRKGLVDMALGTILGSNTLNITVFALTAPMLAFRFTGSAWGALDPFNIVSVATAVVLTVFVLVGIRSRSARIGVVLTRVLLGLSVPVYLIGLYLVYRGTV